MNNSTPKPKKDKVPFAVFIPDRPKPYTVWGFSEKQIAHRFFQRFKIEPTKVVPAYWDMESGVYKPEERQS